MPASDGYQTEIRQLEDSMSSGEAQIRGADGKMVTYRGVAEIREAIGYFRGQAASVSAGAGGMSRTTFATFGRLCG